MRRAGAFLTVLTAILLPAACGSAEDALAEQLQTAVEDYLAGRSDLAAGNMDVSVDAVRAEGNRAQVDVTIAAADDAAAAMRMVYELEKRSGRWRVKPPPPAGGAAAELPPGHPPLDAPGAKLPPGHPPLEDAEQANPRENFSM